MAFAVCDTKLNMDTASKISEKQIPEKSLSLTGSISGKEIKGDFSPMLQVFSLSELNKL